MPYRILSRLYLLLFGLFPTLLLSQPSTPRARVAECAQPGNTVRASTFEFLKYVKSYVLPVLPQSVERDLNMEPLTFDVTVWTDGVPCEVTLAHKADVDLSAAVAHAIWSWRFREAHYQGRLLCQSGRVFVYFRGTSAKPTILVPGLNDFPK